MMVTRTRLYRKGFTLVEVIVVLAILTMLAAIMIPAMTGWIDRAREKRLIVACRSCVNAAQTIASEAYGINETKAAPADGDVLKLAGVNGEVSGISMSDTIAIDRLTYSDGSGDSVTYFRLPNPHYEFGAGGAGGTGGGTGTGGGGANASLSTKEIGDDLKNAWDGTQFGRNENAYSTNPQAYKSKYNEMYAMMSEDVKASLANKVWTLTTTSGGNFRLLIYDGAQLPNRSSFPISVYSSVDGKETNKTGYRGTSGGIYIIDPIS